MAGLGFVAGLPLPLTGFTLRQWLSEGGTSLAVIGLTANIGISYSLKFLWAPALDRVARPGHAARAGPAAGVAADHPTAAGAGLRRARPVATRPSHRPRGASPPASLSCRPARTSPSTPGASSCSPSARRARRWRPISGATGRRCWCRVPRRSGWPAGSAGTARCSAVAALVALGPVFTLLAPAPADPVPRGADGGRRATLREPCGAAGRAAVPPGSSATLGFILLFKLGEAMAGTMAPPFYRSLGFDRAQVALAIGVPVAGGQPGGAPRPAASWWPGSAPGGR